MPLHPGSSMSPEVFGECIPKPSMCCKYINILSSSPNIAEIGRLDGPLAVSARPNAQHSARRSAHNDRHGVNDDAMQEHQYDAPINSDAMQERQCRRYAKASNVNATREHQCACDENITHAASWLNAAEIGSLDDLSEMASRSDASS
ncbi:hypothetical protein FB107DRAFT_277796 [Schizophyllum commune]